MSQDWDSALRAVARSGGAVAVVVAAKGSRARIGAKLLLDRAGNVVGGERLGKELESALQDHARSVIEAAEAKLVNVEDESCSGRVSFFIEPATSAGEVLVLGASPVAEAVARVAAAAGFAVTVHAPSADEERFASASSVAAKSYKALEPPASGVHVVISTAHEDDEGALVAALSGRPASVQLVASAKRARSIVATVEKKGVAFERLALVRSPAGLDLGGESPEEIAVSIVAEIVAIRRGGSLRPLVEVKGAPTSGPSDEEETKPIPKPRGTTTRFAEKPEKPASDKPRRKLKVDGDEEDYRPTSRFALGGVAGAGDDEDLRPNTRRPSDDEMDEPKLRRGKKAEPEPAPVAKSSDRKTGRVTQRRKKLDVEIIDFRPKDADEPDDFRSGRKK